MFIFPGFPIVPAIVVTIPVLRTSLRIVWFWVSDIYKLPDVSTTVPVGVKNDALMPVPFVEPLRPTVPARVEIAYADGTPLVYI